MKNGRFLLKYRLVKIVWSDAMTIKDNWHEIEKSIKEPAVCISVGFLVADNKKVKILYSHIALEDKYSNECGKGNIIIPTSNIISITNLEEEK